MNINDYKNDFEKEINFLKNELLKIRTGRANSSLLDNILVEAYGTKTPLPQMANITIPEPRLLVIQPWDKSIIKEIEKTLNNSDLGFSIKNDGIVLRASLPILTEESRKKLVKFLGEKLEKTRISLRQTRDRIKDEIKEMVNSRELTEDDRYKLLEELDSTIKNYNKKIEEMGKNKEEEIMKV